jgi:hypothetical protein
MSEYTPHKPGLARSLLIASGDLAEAERRAMASKSVSDEGEVWILIGDHQRATLRDLGSILAAFELDSAHALIPPGFLPPRPSGIFVDHDGSLVHGRGRTFPGWALREIGRLTNELVEEHSEYLGVLLRAVQGKPAEVLRPVPEDFVLTDDSALLGFADPPPRLVSDLSGAPSLTPDQIVQDDYSRDRYMGHISADSLTQRIVDVVGNFHIVDSAGLVSVDGTDPEHPLWRALLNELIAEMTLRHGPYPAGWRKDLLDGARFPGSLAGYAPDEVPIPGTLTPGRDVSGSVFVKYGQRQHLESMLERGAIRIAPASSYDDPSLDPARSASELVAEIDVGSFALGSVGGLRPSQARRSGLRRRVRLEMQDYYVFCGSTLITRRLLRDFEADCCIAVFDREEFERRLQRVVEVQLPDWRFISEPVEYYDPLQVTEIEMKPVVSKHFKYAYQKEHRMAWIPRGPIPSLEPIDVEVGGLSDVAELVELVRT